VPVDQAHQIKQELLTNQRRNPWRRNDGERWLTKMAPERPVITPMYWRLFAMSMENKPFYKFYFSKDAFISENVTRPKSSTAITAVPTRCSNDLR